MECKIPIYRKIDLSLVSIKLLQKLHLKSPHRNVFDVIYGVAIAEKMNHMLSKANEVISGLKIEQDKHDEFRVIENRLVAAALLKVAQIKTRKSVGQKEMHQGPSHSKT